jgi:hypothetical protein
MDIAYDTDTDTLQCFTQRYMRERGAWVPDTRDDDTREHDAYDVRTLELVWPPRV